MYATFGESLDVFIISFCTLSPTYVSCYMPHLRAKNDANRSAEVRAKLKTVFPAAVSYLKNYS